MPFLGHRRRTWLIVLATFLILALTMSPLRTTNTLIRPLRLLGRRTNMIDPATVADVQAQMAIKAALERQLFFGSNGSLSSTAPSPRQQTSRSFTTTTAQSAPTPNTTPPPQQSTETIPSTTMSVKETVEQHIKDNHVVVFSKSYCPYCKATKQLLESLDAHAKVFELDQMDEGSDWQAYLGDKTKQRTVPSVWIDGEFIGGNSDVQSANSSGKLVKLINKQ